MNGNGNKQLVWVLAIGGGLLAVVGIGAAMTGVFGSGESGSASNSGSGSGSVATFEAQALALAKDVVTKDGCSLVWVNDAAKTRFSADVAFWSRAVAWAGPGTVDETTSKIATAMVPGCAWPPAVLGSLDLDAALAGTLGMGATLHFSSVRLMGVVDFYLSIRVAVAAAKKSP